MSHSDDPIYKYQPLFGSWSIEEEIGEGSFGIVYLVSKEELGQKYLSAVKLITIPSKEQFREAKSSLGTDENTLHAYFQDVVENIIKEVNILHSLSGNINILNYHDHSVKERDDKIGWDILIRMEYVTSLPKYLETHTLNREQVIRLGIDICTALELCSKKGIVHRDIKDENIFVNKDEIFKLGDFGIARELSGSGRAASMRGTPLYMAPEVYRGEKYDAAVDIYSLGIVLYKLLNNGRMPFMPPFPDVVKYKDGEQALDRRMSGEALPLPVNAGEILGRVVLNACAFRSENRYASAEDLKKALEQVRVELSTEGQERIIMPFASSVTQQNSKILEEKPVGTVSKYAGLQDIASSSKDMYEVSQPINQTVSMFGGLGAMSDDQPAKNNHHDSGDKNSIYQENLQRVQQPQNLQKQTIGISPVIRMEEESGLKSTGAIRPGNSSKSGNEEKSSDRNTSSDFQVPSKTQTAQIKTKSRSRNIWKWVALAGVLALIIGGIVWTNYGRQSDNAQSVITTTIKETVATTTAETEAVLNTQVSPASTPVITYSGRIGIAMPNDVIQRWNQDGTNIKTQLEAAGYTVDLQYANDDVATQVSQIENMITDGCTVLVIAAIDGSSLGTVLATAKEANIFVIAYDRLIMDTDAVSCYVTFDMKRVGALQASYLIDKLGLAHGKGPFNIELFAGSSDDSSATLFWNSAMYFLKEYIDDGQLVIPSLSNNFDDCAIQGYSQDEAQAKMEIFLSQAYNNGKTLDAVLSPNDSISYGIIAALEGAGYNTGEDWPIITGQDAELMAVKNIIAGKQAMSVVKPTSILVAKTVEIVISLIQDTFIESNVTGTYDNGTDIIPTYFCSPEVVDVNNYKKLVINSGMYTEADLAS